MNASPQRPFLSVLLPTYNGGDRLRDAVNSILKQTYANFELLILDDGSHDNSLAGIVQLNDPRLRLIQDGVHQGLAARLNQGIDLARGDYIARMDADDLAFPQRFEKQVHFLNTHPDIDLVAARVLVFREQDDKIEIIGAPSCALTHEAICAKPWRGFRLPHPTWMGRAHWFRRFHYAAPEVVRAEDQDLLLRAHTQSRFACLDEVLLAYRQGAFNLGKTLVARKHLLLAQVRYFIAQRQLNFAVRALTLGCLKVAVDLFAALPCCDRLFFLRMEGRVPAQNAEQLRLLLEAKETKPVRPRICLIAATPLTLHFFFKPHVLALSQKFDVTLVYNHKNDSYLPPLDVPARKLDVGIMRKMSPAQDIVTLAQLCRIFRREKFDLIVSLAPKAGLLGMLAALLTGVPRRVHIFQGEVWASRQGFMRLLLKTTDFITARSATHILAMGQGERAFLETQGVAKKDSVRVLGAGSISGVDVTRFQPDPATRKAVREKYNIPADAVVCLFLGRLTADKGIFDLVRAFNVAGKKNPRLCLLLVGPDEEKIAKQLFEILEPDVAKHTVIDGFTHTPELCLAAADFLCLPSYREGFSVTIIEAAAAGVPAIGSRIYGIADAVVENDTGLLVAPHDVDGLAQALVTLSEDAKLRAKFSLAGRARVCKDFEQQKVVAAYADYFSSLFA